MTRPVRVGFIVRTFTFGGSEVETVEIINGADPSLLSFTGIAVTCPMPLPDDMPPAGGSFPPLFIPRDQSIAPQDPRVRICADTATAVRAVTATSDVVVTWGEAHLDKYLPNGRLPRIVVSSKDSAAWAAQYATANSLLTRCYVANSSVASVIYPAPIRPSVRIIHNGFNRTRATAKISREEQRRRWGFQSSDKVVGYLGRVVQDKGVSRTAAGVALLPEDWKAVFVGKSPNGTFAEELEWICAGMLPGRYRIADWTDDVGSALNAFDVFCHPSDHEGFSNSLAEAWLAGVPTVYTLGTGAIPDLGDLGVPVNPGAEPEEIADAIVLAYGNEALTVRAKHVIESRFLASHMVDRWTAYLREVAYAPYPLRVMILIPGTAYAVHRSWLGELFSHTDLDPCAVIFETDANSVHAPLDDDFYQLYRCPVFRVRQASGVADAYSRIRPDGVVAPPGPASRRLLSEIPGGLRVTATVMEGPFKLFRETNTYNNVH
jgi:glycosyltransferase involved in cell wall biosynthesis